MIDTRDHLVLPGLINAHDHLEFNLYPRLGRGPYPSSRDWSADIYHPDRDPIARHQRVPKRVRLLWGGIKNLLSGVTTVCHHNRRNEPTLDANFPVRVIKRFGWAHSLDFSPDVRERFRRTPKSWPFILHLGEATDARGRSEIFQLHAMGALDCRTVLVHGVALDKDGIALALARGGSLIWCPSSNLFLLGKTLTRKILESGIPVALGSDSALTADGDLLDELRTARRTSRLDSQTLYRMVTTVPRALLRLPSKHGAKDRVLFRDTGRTPAETLLSGRLPELVEIDGKVRLCSHDFADRLPRRTRDRLHSFTVDGRPMLCETDIGALWRETAPILGNDFRVAGKRVMPCT